MRILIEGVPYPYDQVKELVPLSDTWGKVEKDVYMPYVGYYYNSTLGDCVFILPKVVLDENNKVFGKYEPQDIIHFKEGETFKDSDESKAKAEERLIYTLSVWIYRAIVVYKNDKRNDTSIIYQENVAQVGKGKRKQSDTYLDILLALIQFNKDSQSFFMFIMKNLHSGYNKINWARTISKSDALIQRRQSASGRSKQTVLYMNPVNKKRSINFDEELLVIYFSILNHLHEAYGFPVAINVNYTLIRGKQFERYMAGKGARRLKQIKYKYFSDKALQLWELCYAFFDETRQIFVNTNKTDFLLVKNFNIVFEAIIDALIGDDPLPDGMDKKQRDGKIVDHLYTAKSLVENDGQTYYIGDSKYYKLSGELGDESVYKQYTYARNVIQWNLDIFNGENAHVKHSQVKLLDEETEGFNLIPNFFISARLDKQYRYDTDGVKETDMKNARHKSYQFKNRLFDRDTLLLFHYDVNFLYVLSKYGKNKASEISEWKNQVREKFRKTIQEWLKEYFDFYAMEAHPGVDSKAYIRSHFKEVIGKVYAPFNNASIFSLALDKGNEFHAENEMLLTELRKSFYVETCDLGDNPEPKMVTAKQKGCAPSAEQGKNGVLAVRLDMKDRLVLLQGGRIAVPLLQDDASQRVMERITDIGYVLFHVYDNLQAQYLYAVKGNCKVKFNTPDEEYKKLPKNNEAVLFLAMDLDMETKLDTAHVHSANLPIIEGGMKFEKDYNVQFCELEEIL